MTTPRKSRVKPEQEIVITTASSGSAVLPISKSVTSAAPVKKKLSKIALAKKKARRTEQAVADEEKILAALDAQVTSTTEQEHLAEYLYLYRSLKRMSRKAKKQALLGGKSQDYYSYCTLISQQREVIADIRAISDLSGQVQLVIEGALQPMVSSIGQVIVNSFYQQRRLLTETSKEKETQFALQKLDEITKEVSKALQIYYEQAAARIHEVLVGTPDDKPKKKRKR